MLRDIRRDGPQVVAVAQVIGAAGADVVALQGIDWDHDLRAVKALNQALAVPYGFVFARQPNRGVATGLDLDGDGRLGRAGDAQGFGRFLGQGGMAVLSRWPIVEDGAQDLSHLLWKDLPGARLPVDADGGPFPSAEAVEVQRLSTTAHWAVPIDVNGTVVTLLTFHASPPVFDGPEDRNGLRNADELALWAAYSSGKLDVVPHAGPTVLAGDANLDPADGDGVRGALGALVDALGLVDPHPQSEGGLAASVQGGVNDRHKGNPALDTADWDDDGPGNLRVDYVLPSDELTVAGAGVLWPEGGDLAEAVQAASRHRLVWVDVVVPSGGD